MMISKAARIAALLTGGAVLLAAIPAVAQPRTAQQRIQEEEEERQRQQQQQQQQRQQPQAAQGQAAPRQFNLSAEERRALAPLVAAGQAAQTAQAAGQPVDWAALQALVTPAQAVARGNDARYLVSKTQYLVAIGTNNAVLREEALNAIAVNPSTPPAEVTASRAEISQLKNRRAEQAFAANDFATAERIYLELQRETPADERIARNLAIVRARMGNNAGATETLLQSIQRQEAAGQRPPVTAYTGAISTAYRANQREQTLDLLQRLVRAYPTAPHWRDAMIIYREYNSADASLELDALRLLRHARALDPRDYLPFVAALERAGLPGETKAVIDEAGGAATSAEFRQMLANANRRIAEDQAGLAGQIAQARNAANGRQARIMADTLYGYGRYDEAAELYRLALSKGGEDANLINTRLGATLILAGKRAEAEAALRAVTGPRATLAQFWLIRLGQVEG